MDGKSVKRVSHLNACLISPSLVFYIHSSAIWGNSNNHHQQQKYNQSGRRLKRCKQRLRKRECCVGEKTTKQKHTFCGWIRGMVRIFYSYSCRALPVMDNIGHSRGFAPVHRPTPPSSVTALVVFDGGSKQRPEGVQQCGDGELSTRS